MKKIIFKTSGILSVSIYTLVAMLMISCLPESPPRPQQCLRLTAIDACSGLPVQGVEMLITRYCKCGEDIFLNPYNSGFLFVSDEKGSFGCERDWDRSDCPHMTCSEPSILITNLTAPEGYVELYNYCKDSGGWRFFKLYSNKDNGTYEVYQQSILKLLVQPDPNLPPGEINNLFFSTEKFGRCNKHGFITDNIFVDADFQLGKSLSYQIEIEYERQGSTETITVPVEADCDKDTFSLEIMY